MVCKGTPLVSGTSRTTRPDWSACDVAPERGRTKTVYQQIQNSACNTCYGIIFPTFLVRYWNRLFAAFLSVSVLPLNWHTHYSRAFRTGAVLAHAVNAEYPGIREQEQILTWGGVTCPTKFYAGVSAPTEWLQLGCRLGPSISLVSCEDERNASHG